MWPLEHTCTAKQKIIIKKTSASYTSYTKGATLDRESGKCNYQMMNFSLVLTSLCLAVAIGSVKANENATEITLQVEVIKLISYDERSSREVKAVLNLTLV